MLQIQGSQPKDHVRSNIFFKPLGVEKDSILDGTLLSITAGSQGRA